MRTPRRSIEVFLSFFAPLAAAVVLLVAACAPAYDWRQARSADGVVQALFPCKPQQQTRRLRLAGVEVAMSVVACDAARNAFALASVETGDPARVTAVLQELGAATARNIGADIAAANATAAAVPGMTPNPAAQQLSLHGQRPGGEAVQAQVVLFCRGTQAYQALVIGAAPPREAVTSFFGSLQIEGG